MATTGTGLVRVTIAAPRRRVDIALPENVVVAEMLPSLLRHGGEDLADEGVDHGGWALRRADGAALTATKTLGSHRVRDGEVLHLVPGREDWPELDYDDLVDAIANGSRRRSRTWTRQHTRRTGLAIGGVVLMLAMVAVFRSGTDWATAGRWALGQGLILMLAAVVLSRAMGDSGAGNLVGLLALPYAFIGALLEVGSPPLSAEHLQIAITAEQLQIACATLAFAALIGYVGVGDDGALFIAATFAGLLGVLGSYLTGSHGMDPTNAAAILISIALLMMPMYNSFAIWIGRMPLPVLPRTPSDLIRDTRQPARPKVYDAVARADGLLTGMLIGSAAVAAVSFLVLIRRTDHATEWFLVVTTLCYWFRSRSYVIVRQRAAILTAATAGSVAMLLGPLLSAPGSQLTMTGPVILACGAVAIVVGLSYSRRTPGPYLRRYVEVLEILLILAVLPLGAWVLDLYMKLNRSG